MTIKKTVTGSLTEGELIEMIEEKCGFKLVNVRWNSEVTDMWNMAHSMKSISFEVDESQPVKTMRTDATDTLDMKTKLITNR